MRTLTIFLTLLYLSVASYAQQYTPVMVDQAGQVYKPTNFFAANSIGNLYATNPLATSSGTNLGANSAATIVFTNVNANTQFPRYGIVTVFFENQGGQYTEVAQYAYAMSSSVAILGQLGTAVSPTNKSPMTFGGQRVGNDVTLSFTNENTNAVSWRIFVEGRSALP